MSPPIQVGPRRAISNDSDECVVFACEWRSQPHFRKSQVADPTGKLAAKQLRALPLARRSDVVVCSSHPCAEYLSWLEELDFAPGAVTVMDSSPDLILPEKIVRNPSPIRNAVESVGKRPVYVPHYCGPADLEASHLLGAELFGCSEDVSLKYFDKHRFKIFCQNQGVPVVPSSPSRNDTEHPEGVSPSAVERVVRSLLGHYPKVIVRGTEGSAGSSVLTVTSMDVDAMMSKVAPGDAYMVEPFLSVVASPNDQWAILRGGELAYLGTSAQMFDGFCHAGNLAGQYFSSRITDHIRDSSHKLVSAMASGGYRGIAGIDYIITPEGIYPIENNARMNGSTYCLGIVERMREHGVPAQAWKFFRASSPTNSFATLRRTLDPVMYDGSSPNGVFPLECESLAETSSFTAVVFGEDLYHIAYLESVLSELGVRPAHPTSG